VGDEFISFGGGLSFQHPFSKRLMLFGGLAYQNKTNTSEDNFSTYYYDANLGLSYRRDRDTFTLAAQYNSFWVNDTQLYNDAYRNASGVTGQWQHDFDSRNQISVFLQYSDLTYPDQEIRNANRYIGGVGYAHAFGRGTVITYLGLYGGAEKEKDDSAPQVGNDIYGARLGAQWNLNEKYSLFANASGESTTFRVNKTKRRYELDRSASGTVAFSAAFGDVQVAPILGSAQALKLRIYMDHSSLEIFLNEGETVFTSLVFPSVPYNLISLKSDQEIELRAGTIYELQSIWK